MQKQLTKGPLLNESGNLAEAGYAFSLIKEYNRKKIKGLSWRIKEWDYYFINDDKYGLALTIADNSYMAMVSFSILDFVNKKEIITKSIIKFFTFGKWNLPSSSEDGNIVVKNKNFSFEFYNDHGARHLACFLKGKNNDDFSCDVYLDLTNQNSMVIATPFKKDRHFYYNQKINLLSSKKSSFTYGELYHRFNDSALGVLDWGRGIWTYSNTWYWSSLNANYDGHKIGFNLGYGFGDTSAASENMLFVDNLAYKLEDVIFNIPKDSSNKDDFLKEWTIKSKDGAIDLVFKPLIDRYSNMNILILQSLQHQVFGTFSGTFKVNGRTYKIADCIGFAEKVKNRW